ncbi:MAG: PAS domain S-box protein [Melioribacteraceae bacterium]|jgi:PAS domain S-box-containing protein|nr:PAS domain S-box protein [Melioribacteraceae bacterium]
MISEKTSIELKRIKRYLIFISFVSVAVIASSLLWNLYSSTIHTEQIAKSNARVFFEKDSEFRTWASKHGGLYVPLNERTLANPNLAHIHNREIIFPSGDTLTLLNPAYMLRQLQDEDSAEQNIIGNITSLKPLRIQNAPDEWERKALLEFDKGVEEVFEFSKINGGEHLRLIKPLVTKESCLKCHGVQGYKVGDIRGGISVSLPMKPLRAISREYKIRVIAIHIALMIVGFIGIRSVGKRFSYKVVANQKNEEILFEKDERLKLALGATNAGVWDWNIQNRSAVFSERWAEISGYTLAELEPTDTETWNRLVHKDDNLALELELEELFAKEIDCFTFEIRMKHKKGHWIWAETRGDIIEWDNNKPIRMVGFIIDITERKKQEQKLIENEKKYRLIAEHKGQMTYAYNIESGNIEWTGSLIETMGYTKEEFQNIDLNAWESMIHPDDLVSVKSHHTVAIENGSDFLIEYRFKKKDNHYLDVEDRGTFLKDENGKSTKMFGVMKDITEQKLSVVRLEESEKKYRSLAENAVDFIWKIDMELNYLYVSPEIFHLTGYTVDELIGKNAKELFPPENFKLVTEIIDQELALGKNHVGRTIESVYLTKNGKEIPVEITGKIIWDNDGNPVGISGFTRDNTERKKTEEVIKNANTQFTSIINSLDAIVYVADMETYELLFVNSALVKDIGDIKGQLCWQALQINKTGPCEFCTNNKLLTEDGEIGDPYTWEFQNTITGKWYLLKDKAIIWHDGRIVRLEIAADITESKKAEDKLQESEERFRTTFNQAIDPIYIAEIIESQVPQIVDINKAVTRKLGHTRKDSIGKPMNLFHPNENKDEIFRRAKKILSGESLNFESLHQKKDGSFIPVEISAKRIKVGRKYFIYIIQRDISERKKWEKDILKIQKELKKEITNKDKFFSIISHDLKAPFGALLGISQLLEESYDEMKNDERKEMIHVARNSAQNIFSLLEGLLEWSRASTGKMDFSPAIVKLDEVLADVVQVLKQNAKNKNINILVNVNKKASAFADEKMIKTIIRNLLNNAIKFTPNEGEISISSRKTNGKLEVSVTDNGIGITKEDIKKLFRIDVQYTTVGTSNESGTGVGLILCKELVEKNNGKIWVKSELGKGSSFKFTLPIESEA